MQKRQTLFSAIEMKRKIEEEIGFMKKKLCTEQNSYVIIIQALF